MNTFPEEGKLILINKELRWTSFDVVKKVRRMLGIKKVGHAGTLDPLATGLLIICAGKMTKQINKFMNLEKEYEGTMMLGKTTPSVDLETKFDSEHPIENVSEQDIFKLTNKFTGQLMQVPPIFSAIKMDGLPLYIKARKGEAVEIQPRSVEAIEFEIKNIALPEVKFRLVCSKGFYVRSLVRDFGEALGVGAYLASLERTRIGSFRLEDATTIGEFIQSIEKVGS